MGNLSTELVGTRFLTERELSKMPLQGGLLSVSQLEARLSHYTPYQLAPFAADLTWLSKLKARCPTSTSRARIMARAWHGTLLLEIETEQVLIDPGNETLSAVPNDFVPSVIAITHAHADHCGGLLQAAQRYPKASIIMTSQTFRLLQLLPDAALIEALFEARGHLIETDGEPWRVAGITFRAYPAGHLLGAAMLDIALGDTRLLVTGDFALRPMSGLTGAVLPDVEYDVVLMEATHAWDVDEPTADPTTNHAALCQTCTVLAEDAVDRILIFAAALGEAQEVYAALATAQRAGALPRFTLRWTGKAAQIAQMYAQVSQHPLSIWSIPPHVLQHNDSIPSRSIVIASGFENQPHGAAQSMAQNLTNDPNAALLMPQLGLVTSQAEFVSAGRSQSGAQTLRYRLSLHASYRELATAALALCCRQVALYHAPRTDNSPLADLLNQSGRRVTVLSDTIQRIGV